MNFDKKKGLKIASFAGFGALAVAGLVAASQGGMMNLHGQSLVKNDTELSSIMPAAGEAVSEGDRPTFTEGFVTPVEEAKDEHGDHTHEHNDGHAHDLIEQEDVNGDVDVDVETTLENEDKAHNHHGHEHDDSIEWVEEPVDTTCGTYNEWVNKPVDEEAVKAVGREYRILKPNSAMTMDHKPERMNVYINDDGIVLSVMCG